MLIDEVRRKAPLVHNMTNYVTINDCANITLACGASPIMAEAVEEVEEIVSLADGLNLNMGMLTKEKLKAMIAAGKKANALGKPVVLDPVGAGASSFRKQAVEQLLSQIHFTIIRGNLSEIKAIGSDVVEEKGVDSLKQVNADTLCEAAAFAKSLAGKTGVVIIISGAMDIVADQESVYCVYNGSPLMSKVSGTGCMLSSVVAAFVSVGKDNPLSAALSAVCAMGLCGEIAEKRMQEADGNASYRMYLIDAMYHLDGELLEKGARYALYKGNDDCLCGNR